MFEGEFPGLHFFEEIKALVLDAVHFLDCAKRQAFHILKKHAISESFSYLEVFGEDANENVLI